MIGLLEGLKLGMGALAGGALVFGFVSLVTIPAAERAAFKAGEAAREAAVAKEHAAELIRQREAGEAALAAARERERQLAEQADALNDQLLGLAHAITSDDSLARLCLPAERVRDLNAIR